MAAFHGFVLSSALCLLVHPNVGVEVDVEAFGAKADGVTLNTPAFNAALRSVRERGGGTVYARAKGTYIVGWIDLQSNTTLHIAPGTSVNASTNRKHCLPQPFPGFDQCSSLNFSVNTYTCGNVFFAYNANNFSIRGGGTVDGGGLILNNPPWKLSRSTMFICYFCSDVVVEDLKLFNPASGFLMPYHSKHIHFRRLHLEADVGGPHHKNTDGFDPMSSSDVSFTDSYVKNGDDCIAVKSGKTPSCNISSENILVNNITCEGSHGLTLGSELTGGIRNVTFTNIRVSNSQGLIKVKLVCGRHGFVRDILYENITGYNVVEAVGIGPYGPDVKCPINGTTVVSNFTIRNVRVEKVENAYVISGFTVLGRPSGYAPLQDLVLENVSVSDYKHVGICKNAWIKNSSMSPAILAHDSSCVVSKGSSLDEPDTLYT